MDGEAGEAEGGTRKEEIERRRGESGEYNEGILCFVLREVKGVRGESEIINIHTRNAYACSVKNLGGSVL